MTGGVTSITGNVPQGSGALRFDGVDDLVTIANDAALEPADDLTLMLWSAGRAGDVDECHRCQRRARVRTRRLLGGLAIVGERPRLGDLQRVPCTKSW